MDRRLQNSWRNLHRRSSRRILLRRFHSRLRRQNGLLQLRRAAGRFRDVNSEEAECQQSDSNGHLDEVYLSARILVFQLQPSG